MNHTGPLTWRQRAWAAVLVCWPAALDGWSAIRAHEGTGRSRVSAEAAIDVVVAHGRRPAQVAGVRVRRSRGFDETAQLQLSPPRLRYDDAIIDLADRATDELTAIAVLADVGEGTCSVLEHTYLARVERAHGLPRGLRQVADVGADGRRMFRDVVYGGGSGSTRWRQVVELDGRLFHDSATARDRDLERDLDTALGGADTVRLGYGQVLGRPCLTAAKLARLLRLRGWEGESTSCPDCSGSDRVGSRQLG